MKTGKKSIWRVAAAIALMLAAGSAQAAVVYDFDDLANGALNGQDNWTTVSATANQTTVADDGATGSGKYASFINGPQNEKTKRVNDANWSFANTIAGRTTFEIAYWARIGNDKTTWRRGSELFFMDGTVDAVSFGFDYTNTKIFTRAADGTVTYSTDVQATASSEYQWLKLSIDLTGNGGEGSGTVYESPHGDGVNWTAVAGLENIDLQLATSGVDDTSTWDAIAIERNYYSFIDNITVIPEPATIGMLGLGGLITLLIRRRLTM